MSNLIVDQTVLVSVHVEIRRINSAPRVPPFKVTQGHWNGLDRSGTFDFLLTFHSKHRPVFNHFQYNEIISDVYLKPPLRGFSLELCDGAWVSKTKMMGLPRRKKNNLMISLAAVIQYWSVTDRRTDGQTDRHRPTAVPRLRNAYRRVVKTLRFDVLWTDRTSWHRPCHYSDGVTADCSIFHQL